MPAVLISQNSTKVTPSNKFTAVYFTPYTFEIQYIYPITLEYAQDFNKAFKNNTEQIANILMNYRDLDNFIIEQGNDQQGGFVIDTEVEYITFDSEENMFFRELEIPALIASIKFVVGFRTYQNKGD